MYGKKVIIFGDDMNLSVHFDNKGKGILIPGQGPTQRLDDIALTLEANFFFFFFFLIIFLKNFYTKRNPKPSYKNNTTYTN